MILQCMKFKEFQDCKALLDMLDDGEYVMKYKYEIERKFEEMINWFLHDEMGIHSRPIPVYMGNNKRVNLLELYMVVKREGGHRTVTSNNLWAMVSKDMGHDYEDGEYMRIVYAMYLDVIIYYLSSNRFKTTLEMNKLKEQQGLKIRLQMEEEEQQVLDAYRMMTENITLFSLGMIG
ncbi:putative transcription factor & chromatin remodeling ARID family [Helianthus annuus]|nr:putative transcription factor & chromatin remodeling ARID family [Helianthus annuus]